MSEKRRRITAKMKLEIVVRMFRGESLDILSREIDIPAERLTKWKEAFIKGGIENLKIKPNSPEIIENKMLKEMIGERFNGQKNSLEKERQKRPPLRNLALVHQ